MCTISKGIIYPDKDLTVFKVFEKKEDGTLRSVFYHYNWSIGETYRTYEPAPPVSVKKIGTILRGGFHSYQYVLDAIRRIKDLHSVRYDAFQDDAERYVVCRCTIPKDSMFVYESEEFTGNGSSNCYVSEMLRVDEILDVSKLNRSK